MVLPILICYWLAPSKIISRLFAMLNIDFGNFATANYRVVSSSHPRLPETDSGQNEVLVRDAFRFRLKKLDFGRRIHLLPDFIAYQKMLKNTNKYTLGDTIKNARIQAGFTQQQLAKKTGVAWSNFAPYERNEVKRPNNVTLKKISQVLQMPVSELLPVLKTN